MKFSGRIWKLVDESGDLIDDIDTDQIYHNSHLAVTDLDEMGQFTLGNLEGWEDFPEKADEGDIIIAGENFGSGSSRQQAVDCFISLGIRCILARSWGAIYKRNAINSAFPIFTISNLGGDSLISGDRIEFGTESGEIRKDSRIVGQIVIPSEVQMDILEAGGLFK